MIFREDLDRYCHLPLAEFERERQAIEAATTAQEFQAVLVSRQLMNTDF